MGKALPITVRPVKMEDLTDLQALYTSTIDSVCKDDYDQAQRTAWKSGVNNVARWTTALSEQYFLVACDKDAIAGFASLKDGHYIDFMYVGKNHQGKGIATMLYQQLEEEAMKHTGIVSSDVSKTARGFFERMGFVVVKENLNVLRGVEIINYRMEKKIC